MRLRARGERGWGVGSTPLLPGLLPLWSAPLLQTLQAPVKTPLSLTPLAVQVVKPPPLVLVPRFCITVFVPLAQHTSMYERPLHQTVFSGTPTWCHLFARRPCLVQ